MKKKKLSVFEQLSEIGGWIRIVASPLAAFGVMGWIVYMNYKTPAGMLAGFLFTLTGLITGILWASHIYRKHGTIQLLSRVMATPELDDLQDPVNSAFTFRLRPGYGASELIIEFQPVSYGGDTFDPLLLLNNLTKLLASSGFREQKGTGDLVPGEHTACFRSVNGTIGLHMDSWGLIFIMGEQNQKDIRSVARLLAALPEFKELKSNPDDYR